MKNFVIRLILLISIVIFLAGCTSIGDDPNPYLSTLEHVQATEGMSAIVGDLPKTATDTAPETTTVPQPGQTPTQAPATYYYFDPGVNPLTGLPVPDPSILNRRPVMVKVSNWPREGRPHAGLSQADIVFEYFIGYQMNRFLAIYYGADVEPIGPVRSGRLVDAQLVNLYQGLLAYGNADPQVEEVLNEALGSRAFAYKFLPCPPMCGALTHDATGVFADSAAMSVYAEAVGVDNQTPDLRGMLFSAESPASGEPGVNLRVEYANFSIMEWRFAAQTGDYHLWEEAELPDGLDLTPMTDRNNGEPIAFENLVVMTADYIEYAPTLHDIRIQDVRTPQPALLFRDGKVFRGSWRVPEPDRPIIFETTTGQSFPFKPGQTWIVIVGAGSGIQEEGGEWRVAFAL